MPIEATGPNAEQIKYWNETAGPKWVALQAFLDEQIRPLGLMAMERARIADAEHVLDVGCGCGDTAMEIASQVGAKGSVTGIDISTPMLERARQTARQRGVANVAFENADAQTAALPQQRFDLLFSRFGVMFFIDPPAAFANLRRALKAGGRLAFVCWRGLPENPWMFVPVMAAAQHIPLPPPAAPDAPGPFAFADAERVRAILAGAGFTDIAFTGVDETLTIGGQLELQRTAEFLMQMGPTAVALRQVPDSEAVKDKVAAAVREALLPYQTPQGIRMASAAWIVTAHNS